MEAGCRAGPKGRHLVSSHQEANKWQVLPLFTLPQLTLNTPQLAGSPPPEATHVVSHFLHTRHVPGWLKPISLPHFTHRTLNSPGLVTRDQRGLPAPCWGLGHVPGEDGPLVLLTILGPLHQTSGNRGSSGAPLRTKSRPAHQLTPSRAPPMLWS